MSKISGIQSFERITPERARSSVNRTSERCTTCVPYGDTFEDSRSDSIENSTARPSILRVAKLAVVRAEIALGTYETPERIAGTVDRLLDVMA